MLGHESSRIIVRCPACQRKIRLPEGKKGKVRCPRCGASETISTYRRALPSLIALAVTGAAWAAAVVPFFGHPLSPAAGLLVSTASFLILQKLVHSWNERPIQVGLLEPGIILHGAMAATAALFSIANLVVLMAADTQLGKASIAALLTVHGYLSQAQTLLTVKVVGFIVSIGLALFAAGLVLRSQIGMARRLAEASQRVRKAASHTCVFLVCAAAFSIAGGFGAKSLVMWAYQTANTEVRLLRTTAQGFSRSMQNVYVEKVVDEILEQRPEDDQLEPCAEGNDAGPECNLGKLAFLAADKERALRYVTRAHPPDALLPNEPPPTSPPSEDSPNTLSPYADISVAKFKRMAASLCERGYCEPPERQAVQPSSRDGLEIVLTAFVESALFGIGTPYKLVDVSEFGGAFLQKVADAVTTGPLRKAVKEWIVQAALATSCPEPNACFVEDHPLPLEAQRAVNKLHADIHELSKSLHQRAVQADATLDAHVLGDTLVRKMKKRCALINSKTGMPGKLVRPLSQPDEIMDKSDERAAWLVRRALTDLNRGKSHRVRETLNKLREDFSNSRVTPFVQALDRCLNDEAQCRANPVDPLGFCEITHYVNGAVKFVEIRVSTRSMCQ